MKIKCNKYNDERLSEVLYVYAIYVSGERVSFVCSPLSRNGFVVFDEKDVAIVDHHLGPNFVSIVEEGEFTIMHKVLSENDLFRRVSESELGAYENFLRLIGREA